jgi:hypothetical protein
LNLYIVFEPQNTEEGMSNFEVFSSLPRLDFQHLRRGYYDSKKEIFPKRECRIEISIRASVFAVRESAFGGEEQIVTPMSFKRGALHGTET